MIETRRLLLRPPIAADAPALCEGLANFNVTRNTSRIPHPYTLADAEDFVAKPGDELKLMIVEMASNRLIGGIGLSNGEIGYWLAEPFWAKGYGFEAADAVTHYHFKISGMDHLKASYHLGNDASGKILAKLGFKPSGEQLTFSLAQGRDVPTMMMRLTR